MRCTPRAAIASTCTGKSTPCTVLGAVSLFPSLPSTVQGVDFPVHVLAIAALGVHLIDYLDFSALAPLCAEFRQWSFLCVVAPLGLALATGSPVNPIAIL